jgi:hypothetical protein
MRLKHTRLASWLKHKCNLDNITTQMCAASPLKPLLLLEIRCGAQQQPSRKSSRDTHHCMQGCAHMQRCCDALYCAAGVHTAAGAALGSTDLHSLCHLLAGPAANLAALSLQLPPGVLPDTTTASADPGSSSSSSSSSSSTVSSELLSLAGSRSSSHLLTAGVQLTPEHCLSESLTLRGETIAPCLEYERFVQLDTHLVVCA